jgi:hypothetical protein
MAFIDDLAPVFCPDGFFLCPSSLRTLLIKSKIGFAPLRLALTISAASPVDSATDTPKVASSHSSTSAGATL